MIETSKTPVGRNDIWILINAVLLTIFGLFALYSTSLGPLSNVGNNVFTKQIMFLLIGLICYYVIQNFDYTLLKNNISIIVLGISGVAILVLVLLFGVVRNGAKRWLDAGFTEIQPAEFAKIILIFVTSYLFAMEKKSKILGKWRPVLLSLLYSLIIFFLIFREPDAGMTIISFVIWIGIVLAGFEKPYILIGGFLIFVLLGGIGISLCFKILPVLIVFSVILAIVLVSGIYLAGRKKIKIPREFIITISICAVLGFSIGFSVNSLWNSSILKDYQKERIISFISINKDINDSDDKKFHVIQSIVAIGSGRFLGKGLGHGTQSKLNFLPEHETDFIFASFAEEFGFIGSFILILLYIVFLAQLIYASAITKDVFGSLIIWGAFIKFCIEVFINIGMNLGITPATGVPLPFMSAGGSNLLSNYILLGIVKSIQNKESEYLFLKE